MPAMMRHCLRRVRPVFSCLLAASLCAGSIPAAAAAAAAPSPLPEEVRTRLDAAARAHLDRVIRTLRPNRDNREVARQGSDFVATYLVVDADRMTTELIDGQGQDGAYVGNVIYVVHEYRCTGATREEALTGPCRKAKSRRVREFTRYADGKWHL